MKIYRMYINATNKLNSFLLNGMMFYNFVFATLKEGVILGLQKGGNK